MSEHRFREHLLSSVASGAVVGAAMNCAFVPCPMFSGFSVSQQSQVQEIYRIAAERTREQLRRRRPFPPLFSAN